MILISKGIFIVNKQAWEMGGPVKNRDIHEGFKN